MESFESNPNNYQGGGTGFRGRESNPRVNLYYREYKNGDKVTVIRSDGTRETDWNFSHQRMDTGEIVVTKNIDGKTAQKNIPVDFFDKIQQQVDEDLE